MVSPNRTEMLHGGIEESDLDGSDVISASAALGFCGVNGLGSTLVAKVPVEVYPLISVVQLQSSPTQAPYLA
jgi:hypothetical protein